MLALGLSARAGFLAAAAYAQTFAALSCCSLSPARPGASVNSASGRAVMHWFAPSERGLALGIRQTAIPLGGLIVALVVPQLAASEGSRGSVPVPRRACGARRGSSGARDPRRATAATSSRPSRSSRRSATAGSGGSPSRSGLYLYAQVAVIGFGVSSSTTSTGSPTRTRRSWSRPRRCSPSALRIGAGRWSDLVGSRVGPLRRVGLAVAVSRRSSRRCWPAGRCGLLVPALAVAGGLSMAWNGLSFTAAAELAGAARSGAAIGFQQTVLSGLGVARADPVRAERLVVRRGRRRSSIAALLPLAGWRGLRPLRAY